MKKTLFLIVVLVLLGFSYFFFMRNLSNSGEGKTIEGIVNTENGTSTLFTTESGGITYSYTDEPAVFTLSTSTSKKLLELLDRPIAFSPAISPDLKKKWEGDIKTIVASLRKDLTKVESWIDLGTYMRNAGDYEGAKKAWEAASAVNSKNPLPYSNLGNLYGYYLKDNIKAESYYLKSIEKGPNDGFWYYQTFMFYIEVMKDNVKAKNIIEKGIENNPGDQQLKEILSSLNNS